MVTWAAGMDCKASTTAKPFLTSWTLKRSTLLRNWFLPLCQTLVPLLVAFYRKGPQTFIFTGIAFDCLLAFCAALCGWCLPEPFYRCHATSSAHDVCCCLCMPCIFRDVHLLSGPCISHPSSVSMGLLGG